MRSRRFTFLVGLWAVSAILGVRAAAQVPPITIPIVVGDKTGSEKVGDVYIQTDPKASGDVGITGYFGVSKEDGNGDVLTLQELEAMLGQDHLNWFQKVTSLTPPGGLPVPFVDPPSGGLGTTWADAVPWYFDETPAPNPLPPGKTNWNADNLLGKNISFDGTQLLFEDTPNGQPIGTQIGFSTFLVSDYDDKTYGVMGGFSWGVTIGADGLADVTSLAADAPFLDEYAQEIQAFGYKQHVNIPEPPGLLLIVAGAIGVLAAAAARTA